MDSHGERAHARFAPSSAGRNLICNGSVALIEKLLEEGKIEESGGDSVASVRGTMCHEQSEDKVRRPKISLKSRLGKAKATTSDGTEVIFNEEMLEAVEAAVKEAKDFMKLFPKAHWDYEVKMQPADGIDGAWGTVDILGLMVGECVIIADYKFGTGPVSDKDNKQFKEYGRLAAPLALVDFSQGGYVIAKVIQPHRKTKAKNYATYSGAEMLQHVEEMKELVDKCHVDNLNPSDSGCHWCDARKHCPAKTSDREAKAAAAFSPVVEEESKEVVKSSPMGIELPPVSEVEPEKVQHIMAFDKVYQTWIKEFKKVMQGKSDEGESFPGTKIVTGKKGTRKWAVSDKEMISYFVNFMAKQEKDITESKVLSVAKAEKVLTTSEMNMLEKWITQEDGKATLALEDDKRKNYDLSSFFKPVEIKE